MGRAQLRRAVPISCNATRAVMLRQAAEAAGLAITALPEGLHLRRAGKLVLVFNYAAYPQALPERLMDAPVIGDAQLPPAGAAVGLQVASEM